MNKVKTPRLLLTFLSVGILFLSCGKDQPLPTPEEMLLGTWYADLTASTFHEESDFDGELEIDDHNLRQEGIVECRLVFRDDGIMEMTTIYDYGEGQREQYTDNVSYVLDGDYLVWEGEERLRLTHIDPSRLVLDEHGESVDEDGTYRWDMHLECNKQ